MSGKIYFHFKKSTQANAIYNAALEVINASVYIDKSYLFQCIVWIYGSTAKNYKLADTYTQGKKDVCR